ncbi:pectin lyase fold/virulence factor [Suillus fuscotomentosus]|uniref:endo-polygalacturonase n=1 Tax=Suillus fuscotomentosus TaxID=1912939 RepID=A0AAD4HHJ3_9AGAM|nr:pectin lyase fold/virulence factor [Suillus fuscotomentosus]KAG1896727.1 pectin lyase fold/virulence factor [Suillus fuscotomentosus]
MFPSLALGFLVAGITAVAAASSSSCVGKISSLDTLAVLSNARRSILIAFTALVEKQFELQLLDGTTVNVLGEIQFGNLSWAGPLFRVIGNDVTFNGNNQRWDGGGPFYWDGQGAGITTPHPMMQISISGTLNNVYVVNSPSSAFAITNPGPLTISGATVDDLQGNYPNSRSGNATAAHNTDGFDVSGSDILIQHLHLRGFSTVLNQDDCLAINSGTNITFADNYCEYGHGISIGSISSNAVVSDIKIIGNHVVSSAFSFRIKTDASATNSIVKNVTYSDNTATNCTGFGVLITQVRVISVCFLSVLRGRGFHGLSQDINFNHGTTSVTANRGAYRVAVNCGSGSCTGDWDWSGLQTSGGKAGSIVNNNLIAGFVDTR